MSETNMSKLTEQTTVQSPNKMNTMVNVKQEDVAVKGECECVCCCSVSADDQCCDVFTTRLYSANSVYTFLCQYLDVELTDKKEFSKFICRTCHNLIDTLVRSEIEYKRLRQNFEDVIKNNPLLSKPEVVNLNIVKKESNNEEILIEVYPDTSQDIDSDDEPLAITKKKKPQKSVSKKKKGKSKHSVRSKSRHNKNKNNIEEICDSSDSWKCDLCSVVGYEGDTEKAEHMLSVHNQTLPVKKENSNSENDRNADVDIKMEFDMDDALPSPLAPSEDSLEVENIKVRKTRKTVKKKRAESFQCDQCKAMFTSAKRLEIHSRLHDAGPPYICEVCGAHYKHRRACEIHIQMHKGISDWKCEQCDRLFPSKGALARHNNIHTGKPKYQCDQCGKSFIHTSSFKMHKLSHSGLKPHVCALCGLALMTSSHLKRHLRIHSGEKRYECDHCGKRFSERYNLMAHAKSHSPGPGGAGTGAGGAGGVGAGGPGPGGVRRDAAPPPHFRCHFCTERFPRRYQLEEHSKAQHGRALERPAARPRNTMNKMLKAKAALSSHPSHPSHAAPSPGACSEPAASPGGGGGGNTRVTSRSPPPAAATAAPVVTAPTHKLTHEWVAFPLPIFPAP